MLYRQPKKRPLSEAISLSKISSQSSDLENLIQKADQLQSLQALVDSCLPKLFHGKFVVNGVTNNQLTLTCHSASFATKLRFHQSEILNHLNTKLARRRITGIQIKIRPATRLKAPDETKREISKENAQLLSQEAEQTTDKKLKEALLRLAEHANKS